MNDPWGGRSQCEARSHNEYDCPTRYMVERSFTRDKWCKKCLERYPEIVDKKVPSRA